MKRREKKDQTRELLLEKAYQIFSTEGILPAKTADIAKAASLSHGALFLHFSTKEALIKAVIEQFAAQLSAQFEQKMSLQMSLKSLLEGHLAVIEAWEPFYRQLVLAGPFLPEPVRTTVFLVQSGIGRYFMEAVKKEGKEGGLEPDQLLNSWLGSIHYYLIHKDLFAPNTSVIARVKPKLMHFFLKLINKE